MVTIRCVACQKSLQLPEQSQGKVVRCPGCKSEFRANAPEINTEPFTRQGPVEVSCAQCQCQLKIPNSAIGKLVRCQKCRGTFVASVSAAVQTVETALTASIPPLTLEIPPKEPPFVSLVEQAPSDAHAPPLAEPIYLAELYVPPVPRRKIDRDEDVADDDDFVLGLPRSGWAIGFMWLAVAFDLIASYFYVTNLFGPSNRGPDRANNIAGGLFVLLVFNSIPCVFTAIGALQLRNGRGKGFVITATVMVFIIAAIHFVATAALASAITTVVNRRMSPPLWAYLNLMSNLMTAVVNTMAGVVALGYLIKGKAAASGPRWKNPLPKSPRFNLVVQSDPSNKLDGTYRTIVVASGLLLRQGREEVLLPVGSQSQHLGRAVLEIAPPGGKPVIFQLVNRLAFQARLAEDVVEYLSSTRKTLKATKYNLPLPLYFIAALLLGMPFFAPNLGFAFIWTACFLVVAIAISTRYTWNIFLRVCMVWLLNVVGYGTLLILASGGFSGANRPRELTKKDLQDQFEKMLNQFKEPPPDPKKPEAKKPDERKPEEKKLEEKRV